MLFTLPFLASLALAGSEDALQSSVVLLPGDGSVAALRALREPGLRDLLLLTPEGVEVRPQDTAGGFAADPTDKLSWPSEHLAWDVVDLEGDGLFELVLLHGDGLVSLHAVDGEGHFREARELLRSQSYLPRGVSRMRFARDVNADGRADLVLPAAGIFRVYVQDAEGAFAAPLEIEYEADVRYDVGNPRALDSEFSQVLRIPFFSLEDIDGDGVVDLVSRTEERVDFHLARPTISSEPSWSLDLLALAASLPKRDGVDLDDLISNLDQGVKWSVADVDGVAPRDLLLQLGATMRVYLGGSTSGTSEAPDQVLKISGNLLHYFLRDVSGDELPELQLLRGERISLGRVLRWLILPGSLDFEFFTYENTAGEFSRKPTRRNTVTLEIPRLLSLMDEVDELEQSVEEQLAIPTVRADLDGGGAAADVVDLVDGELRFYRGIAPPEELRFRALQQGDLSGLLEELVLDDVNQLEDGATKTIDLGDVVNWSFSPGVALRQAIEEREPAFRAESALSGEEPRLRALDLDGDGRDDLLAWVELEDGSVLLQLLVQAQR
jgi:hypothetical protein